MKIHFLLLGTIVICGALCGCSQNSDQPTTAQEAKAFQGGPPTPDQIKEMEARRSNIMSQPTSNPRVAPTTAR